MKLILHARYAYYFAFLSLHSSFPALLLSPSIVWLNRDWSDLNPNSFSSKSNYSSSPKHDIT